MLLGGEAFGMGLGHEDGAFMMGISAPRKQAPESSLIVFLPEDGSLKQRRGFSPEPNCAGI